MSRTDSRAHVVFARALRVAVIMALVAVMVPVGAPAALAQTVTADTFYVDAINGIDAPGRGSEAEPFARITYAVSQSDALDTIMVEPGTYNGAINEVFPITLSGQSLRSTGGPGTTTIQGNGSQALLIFNIWTSGDMLEGFLIDDGGSAGVSPAVQINLGAGATSPNAPLITNNVFIDNDGISGGALLIEGADTNTAITIESNTFINNSADEGGAVKFDSHGSLYMSDNSFESNTAFRGGAVYLETWDAICTVNGNTFDGNVATGGGGAGGGLYWQGYGSSLQHNLGSNAFWDCTATVAGGAIYFTHVRALVNLTNAAGSSAPFGGFAYLEQGIITAENNYLTEHSASSSGVVWELDSNSSLWERNDTVYAQASGPEVAFLEPGGLYSTLEITNCIYWNPLVTNEIEGAESLSYTCSYDDATTLAANSNTVGAGMVYANPGLDPGDLLQLLPTSPCVDTGNPASYPTVDFFGTARPQGPGPDIGAYEMPQSAPLSVYRFFRPSTGTHFYTADESEMLNVRNTLSGIYAFEGPAYTLDQWSNATPLHRFFRPSTGTHFYTASATEKANVQANLAHIYTYEGPAYNVSLTQPASGVQVWRFYNTRNGTHFYTASTAERDNVIATLSHIYQYEGPAFWIGQ